MCRVGLHLMFKTALLIALLIINRPALGFGGLRNYWQKRSTLLYKIDLCNQPCYNEIIPGLYLGNARTAVDPPILRRLNITHILTIEAHRLPKHLLEDTRISTMYIRANDTAQTNLLQYFPAANKFIDDALVDGTILVHCHFGVSRSATIVIAYIMQKYKLSFAQAFEYVQQRRNFINPNPGFVNQLKEYERLNYEVGGLSRFEAYMNINARKHKYKIVSAAAILVGVLVPIAVLVLYQVPIPITV